MIDDRLQCIVNGRGCLRHRFWSEYSAMVGIQFSDAPSAADALRVLGPPWHQADDHLLWTGSEEALTAMEARIAPYLTVSPCGRTECRGKVHSIASLAHSIDYGPMFTVEIPIVPIEQGAFTL